MNGIDGKAGHHDLRVRFRRLSVFLLGGCIQGFVLNAALPTNDTFTQRIPVEGSAVHVTADNREATREPGEPLHNDETQGKSVWWSWVAPDKGFATVTTAGSTFDTVLAVYTGSALTSLTRIAVNDDGASDLTSKLVFPVVGGRTYQIAVDGFSDGETVESGTVQLRIDYAKEQLAPAWNLKDVDGKVYASTQFAGKVVLVNFWATWCGPCVAEMPGLVALQNRYRDQGLSIVGISVDDAGPSVVRSFIPQHKLNYTIVMTDGQVERDFGGIEFIPTSFLIDREGNLIDKWVGYTEESDFESSIVPALGPSEPPQASLTWNQGRLLLSWPGEQSGVTIETAATVLGPWVNASVSGVATNGRFEASLSPSGTSGFFRLRR